MVTVLDFRQMKLPLVVEIHPESDKFAMGVEKKATGLSKLNDSPAGFRCVKHL